MDVAFRCLNVKSLKLFEKFMLAKNEFFLKRCRRRATKGAITNYTFLWGCSEVKNPCFSKRSFLWPLFFRRYNRIYFYYVQERSIFLRAKKYLLQLLWGSWNLRKHGNMFLSKIPQETCYRTCFSKCFSWNSVFHRGLYPDQQFFVQEQSTYKCA